MKAVVSQVWYEPHRPNTGFLHVVLVETCSAGAELGEVVSRQRRNRKRRRRELVLVVTNNIPDFTGLMPGEIEIILPVVTRLLDDLSRSAEPQGTHAEAEAKQEG